MYRINPFSSPLSNNNGISASASLSNSISNSNNVVPSKIDIQQTDASLIANSPSNVSDDLQPSSSYQFNSVDVNRSFASSSVSDVLNSKMSLASSSGCVTAQR